jgi:ABC-2 type transport system permease protein
MSKIGIIISREYTSRVKNKTFLLSTFLLPIMMFALIFGSAYFAATSKDNKKRIAVINDPGLFQKHLKSDSTRLAFVFTTGMDSTGFEAAGFDGLLNLNNDSNARRFVVYSKKQLGMETKNAIETRLDRAFEKYQLEKNGIQKSILDSISKQSSGAFSLTNRVTKDAGETEQVNAALNYGVGFGSGILIYITMFIFGAMVMRGVMEEKTNRIAEVMVSSVKPFDLMMGKILGIAAVGLTQLILWIMFILLISTAAGALIPSEMMQQAGQMSAGGGMPVQVTANNESLAELASIRASILQVNWALILGCFVFYFLGGYLFYAALFAAIGSVINEDPQEAQSLMLPITMPIIFGFIIMSSNLNTPDSPIMVWASMIPFTSPIVMMARIPSGVPAVELIASMALLIGGFYFTTWLAAKIYRTGILMYGKKVTWKEMFKWAFKKS